MTNILLTLGFASTFGFAKFWPTFLPWDKIGAISFILAFISALFYRK